MKDKIISIIIYLGMFLPLIFIGILFVSLSILIPSKMNIFGRITSIAVLKCFFIKLKINGRIPIDRPLILMYNHSSFIDPFLFAYSSPGKTTGITAVENLKFPIFGWMLKKWKAIPIDRTNIETAKESIKRGEKAFEKGYKVIILPEGTRTITGKIKRFKKGGFHMAINTNAPILPIGCKGAFEFKPKNRWYIKPRTIHLNVGTIIEPQDFKKLGINGLVENVRNQFAELTDYELEA